MSTGKRNKQRGYETEKQVVDVAIEHGLKAERAFCSNGRALGKAADVDVLIEDRICVQVKRRKTLPNYLELPASCDVVVFRQERKPLMVMMTYNRFLRYIKQEKGK